MPFCTHEMVATELVGLCREIGVELRQELVYYRASVYKEEAAAAIHLKIGKLRGICELFCEEHLLEPFSDFAAKGQSGQKMPRYGECFFSTRVVALIDDLYIGLEGYLASLREGKKDSVTDLTEGVAGQRNTILSLCQHGSRYWDFFTSL